MSPFGGFNSLPANGCSLPIWNDSTSLLAPCLACCQAATWRREKIRPSLGFPCSPRASRSARPGTPQRVFITVGCRRIHCPQDWLRAADLAGLGEACRRKVPPIASAQSRSARAQLQHRRQQHGQQRDRDHRREHQASQHDDADAAVELRAGTGDEHQAITVTSC